MSSNKGDQTMREKLLLFRQQKQAHSSLVKPSATQSQRKENEPMNRASVKGALSGTMDSKAQIGSLKGVLRPTSTTPTAVLKERVNKLKQISEPFRPPTPAEVREKMAEAAMLAQTAGIDVARTFFEALAEERNMKGIRCQAIYWLTWIRLEIDANKEDKVNDLFKKATKMMSTPASAKAIRVALEQYENTGTIGNGIAAVAPACSISDSKSPRKSVLGNVRSAMEIVNNKSSEAQKLVVKSRYLSSAIAKTDAKASATGTGTAASKVAAAGVAKPLPRPSGSAVLVTQKLSTATRSPAKTTNAHVKAMSATKSPRRVAAASATTSATPRGASLDTLLGFGGDDGEEDRDSSMACDEYNGVPVHPASQSMGSVNEQEGQAHEALDESVYGVDVNESVDLLAGFSAPCMDVLAEDADRSVDSMFDPKEPTACMTVDGESDVAMDTDDAEVAPSHVNKQTLANADVAVNMVTEPGPVMPPATKPTKLASAFKKKRRSSGARGRVVSRVRIGDQTDPFSDDDDEEEEENDFHGTGITMAVDDCSSGHTDCAQQQESSSTANPVTEDDGAENAFIKRFSGDCAVPAPKRRALRGKKTSVVKFTEKAAIISSVPLQPGSSCSNIHDVAIENQEAVLPSSPDDAVMGIFGSCGKRGDSAGKGGRRVSILGSGGRTRGNSAMANKLRRKGTPHASKTRAVFNRSDSTSSSSKKRGRMSIDGGNGVEEEEEDAYGSYFSTLAGTSGGRGRAAGNRTSNEGDADIELDQSILDESFATTPVVRRSRRLSYSASKMANY